MSKENGFVIQTRGLSKAYPGVVALNSLDLEVPKNSIFAFLGPNGAGKTTTIKLLLGLIKPTGGSGTIFGKELAPGLPLLRTHDLTPDAGLHRQVLLQRSSS